MSKIAWIYPGQGAQKAGMGADFYERSETARAIYDRAGEILGLDMKALCFEENEKLDLTWGNAGLLYRQSPIFHNCRWLP